MRFNLSGYQTDFLSLFICLSLSLCILSYLPLPLLSQFHSFTVSPPLSGRVYLFLIKVMSQWVDATRASNTLRQFVSAHVTFQTGSVSLSRVLWTMSHWCPSVLSHYHTSAPFTDNYNEFKQSKKVRHSLNAITGCVRTENTHTHKRICVLQGERASGKCSFFMQHMSQAYPHPIWHWNRTRQIHQVKFIKTTHM